MMFNDIKMRASVFRSRESVRSRVSTMSPPDQKNGNHLVTPHLERKSTQYLGMDSKFVKAGSNSRMKMSNKIRISRILEKRIKP